MPNLLPSNVHVDAPLTSMSTAYLQDEKNFIAASCQAWVPSKKQSDLFFKYNKEDFRRSEMGKRGPGSDALRGSFGMSTDSFFCNVFALDMALDDQLIANADDPLRPKEDALQYLQQQLLIEMEEQWVSAFWATSIWGTDQAVSYAWSDYGSSNPKADVLTGQNTILQNTGRLANTLIVPWSLHKDLVDHPNIRDQFKYTSSESINEAMLAKYFEVDHYKVLKASEVTSNEGASSHTNAFVAGSTEYALLCYNNPSASLMAPSAMYAFGWTGMSGAGQYGNRVLRYEEARSRSEVVGIEAAFDFKVVGSDLGYLMTGV